MGPWEIKSWDLTEFRSHVNAEKIKILDVPVTFGVNGANPRGKTEADACMRCS